MIDDPRGGVRNMCKPDDHELQETHDRLRKHYGADIDKALADLAGDQPTRNREREEVPSKHLVQNVFMLGEPQSTRSIPGRKNPSWNGWDTLVDRMKILNIP
jgi:hypothetical protein